MSRLCPAASMPNSGSARAVSALPRNAIWRCHLSKTVYFIVLDSVGQMPVRPSLTKDELLASHWEYHNNLTVHHICLILDGLSI